MRPHRTLSVLLPDALAAVLGSLALGAGVVSAGQLVNYSVPSTGQTATADFSFTDDHTLSIVLTETTPAATSLLTGDGAVLTTLGFHLPGALLSGGTVQIGPGGVSVGFDNVPAQLAEGADVSAEWGYSQGSLKSVLMAMGSALLQESNSFTVLAASFDAQAAVELQRAKAERDAAALILSNNPDEQAKKDALALQLQADQDERDAAAFELQAKAARDQAKVLRDQAAALFVKADAASDDPYYDLIGVLDAQTTRFATGNLDGPDPLNGAQGGLLADSVAGDGLGVINHSVTINLNLSGPLDSDTQAAFLRGLATDSFVEYGPETAFAAAAGTAPSSVPEPCTLVLWSGLVAVVMALRLGTRKVAGTLRVRSTS